MQHVNIEDIALRMPTGSCTFATPPDPESGYSHRFSSEDQAMAGQIAYQDSVGLY